MAPSIIHLPDGQTFTVTTVFAGLGFKSHELNTHPNPFPVGWTVVLNTEEEDEQTKDQDTKGAENGSATTDNDARPKKHIHSFTKPSLQGDNLFISSISNPSSTEFKPAASPTRQLAMILWITLYWYFHQPEPAPHVHAEAAKLTPVHAKPRGEWKINIKRDGVLRGRNLIPKLERMGLITTEDTAVGISDDDNAEGWQRMFVSRRMFWQLPGRLFLFSLQPNMETPFPGSPMGSRPSSPIPGGMISPFRNSYHSPHSSFGRMDGEPPGGPMPTSMAPVPSFPIGPFFSSSHLPTYFPPAPLQYRFTNNIRHPLRSKPPRMGEVFYTRFVPSVGQYLSFRVASSSPKPVPYYGPVGPKPPEQQAHLSRKSDTQLLETWMSKPRVNAFWQDYGPDFLKNALNQPHSFPVIGQWDGVPFGYFEIYWVKEDLLGQYLGGEAGEWDRGLHVLIGEEWARGRVPIWLTGLVHWCLTSDYRTMNISLEPRVDNARFLQRLEFTGFSRERQLSFPHKQSWYVRLRREQWEGPAL
ncbi:Fc.00g096480.m01.CDS01 [Cosmosporella sp. VM-42]